MGHCEILALTYPKRRMPPSAESGNSKTGREGRRRGLVKEALL
jgi:hypothetical protein